ncbi:hypothetical protein EPN96_03075 [bacterium]|nr:MAG: hypothetical protein EPN96_03075 [bacterium]
MKSRRSNAAVTGRAGLFLNVSVLLIAMLAPGAKPAFANRQIAGNHNFVVLGSTASGICDVCHAAGGGAQGTQGQDSSLRVFRFPGADDIARCSGNCHSAPNYPIEGITVSAPQPNHLAPVPANQPRCFNNTVGCHLAATYWDCLLCHNQTFMQNTFGQATGNDSALNAPGIDKFRALASHKHTTTYAAPYDNAANNSCLKCHGMSAGTAHPGGATDNTGVLVYPDSVAGHAAGEAIIPSSPTDPDYHEYQDFCLSCHDGRADAGVPAAIQLNGASVPAMPRFDYNEEFLSGGSRTFPSNPPYLALSATSMANYPANNYFEKNGHGRATSLGGSAMNLTCLEKAGTGTGCHSVHGTANTVLLDDEGFVASTPPVDTISELGNNVCMTCHPRNILGAGTGISKFHSWLGTGGVLHAGPVESTVVWGSAASDANMEVNDPGTQVPSPTWYPNDNARILPFYALPATLATSRLYYVTGTNNFVDNMSVACVTCHDPHGTSDFYQGYNADTGTCIKDAAGNCYQTVAMLRKFMSSIDFGDPLCSECHVEP